MKKISIILSILSLIIAITTLFIFLKNSQKVAYVDINVLVDKYERTAIVRKDFLEKSKTLNSNVDSLVTQWKKEIANYEKERTSMTQKEIKLKEEILSNKQQQINNYQKAIQETVKKEDQNASQTVLNDINEYVKEYGDKNNYQIIMGANGNGNVMYAKDYADLTGEILEGLNSQFKQS
ncbi:OmpH family outer membrane protein [Psychroflexus tropicus]|uniref:OmpH family outer membrane protein n=1 Tax=Psychroflexus tropicus TaxID=197345 RepID=UPI00035FAF40|nr:OmpH family outer membrane protein [Psychroflexus tropicus]